MRRIKEVLRLTYKLGLRQTSNMNSLTCWNWNNQ
jgi:hypothetical protein